MTIRSCDPLSALKVLKAHDVRFIIIGGIAGRIWGSPSVTNDLDVCYSGENANLQAMADALQELHAELRGSPPGLPFVLDAWTLRNGDTFTFDTDTGPLDIARTPAGTDGFSDLARSAKAFILDDGVEVYVTSIEDLMRMKRAAGRPKDRIELEVLAALEAERRRS